MGPETDGICVLIRVKKRLPYLLLRRDNREPFFSFLPPSLSPPPSLSLWPSVGQEESSHEKQPVRTLLLDFPVSRTGRK